MRLEKENYVNKLIRFYNLETGLYVGCCIYDEDKFYFANNGEYDKYSFQEMGTSKQYKKEYYL